MLDGLYRIKNAPLLPNLRHASIQKHSVAHSCDAVHLLSCICPPELTELSLIYPVGPTRRALAGNELPALASACPSVQRAALTVDPADFSFITLAETIVHWRRLSNLKLCVASTKGTTTVTVVDNELLHTLSNLPALAELTVRMGGWTHQVQLRGEDLPYTFRTLRRLHISVGDVTITKTLLEEISSPGLRELEITTGDVAVFSDLPLSLPQQPFTASLTKLSISGNRQSGGHNIVTPGSALLPLIHLRHLQYLLINVFG